MITLRKASCISRMLPNAPSLPAPRLLLFGRVLERERSVPRNSSSEDPGAVCGRLPPSWFAAIFGAPSSQAAAGEIHTLWEQLQNKFPKDALDHLGLVRRAVANHQLLLRFRGAPPRTDAALDMARSLRDAMDTALTGVTLKDKPLRAGLEISPNRKDRLSKFFRAQDSLLQHWKDLGLEAQLTPCVATLRIPGPRMHVVGSLGRSGTWQWRREGFDAEKLGHPPPSAGAPPTAASAAAQAQA